MIVELLIGGGIWLTGRVAEWTIERILDRTYDYYATDSRIRRAIDNIRGGLGDPASIRIILDAIKSARESDPGFRRAMQDITTRDLPEFAMDPFPYPPTLFGRDLQLGDLRTLLDCDTPNVVQVVGTSGVGKTVLAAQAIFDLACDYVRLELDRTETPESIIVRLYELLHWQAAPERPHKDLIGNILEAWKARDCVLVLDNLHVLLNDHANPKDDLAKLLLDRLGGSGQKLLTLGWPSTTAMGGARERVREFLVKGIDEDEGVRKLRAEGVVGSPETITLEQVVLNLDGN
ncbi:AAA family ATPase, partial [bacterium]|nr:AAA family ATPase [bacterium]